MSKDVMIYLDGSPIDELRLGTGEYLADLFGGHVLGLFINVLPDPVPPVEPAGAALEFSTSLQNKAREVGDQREAILTTKLALLKGPAELRRFDVFADQIGDIAASEARTVDTFVATCPSADRDSKEAEGMLESVLLGSGRHIFVACGSVPSRRDFRHALIGWNGSREAARAVAESLPFLLRSQKVTVLVVDDGVLSDLSPSQSVNLTQHLLRYDINVTLEHAERNGESVSTRLIEEARRRDVDLIVIGGYSHSRMREHLLGGVTYDLLHHAPAPILMAH
jgi:nucleotide-binding universal stress UspA family protein